MGLARDEIRSLKQALETLAEALVESLASTKRDAGPVDLDEPIGRVSRMDAITQQNMLAANRRAAELRRGQVAAALSRVEQGEYGDCLVCGEEIGYRRLSAQPEAPLCLSCQSTREQKRD